MLRPTDSLCLYGATGSGKTTQAALLARALYEQTKRPARAYVTDWGGLEPYEDQPFVELVRYGLQEDPWLWIHRAANTKADVSLVIYDSLSSMGDLLLNHLAQAALEGRISDATKAPVLVSGSFKTGGNSQTHYGMTQRYLLRCIWESQALGVPVLWLAHEDLGDPEAQATSPGVRALIGPLVVGKAMTTNLPKYFRYTLRLKELPGGRHVLYTDRHQDGFYEGLAMVRAPLGVKVPLQQEPADLVKLLGGLRHGVQNP